MSVRDLDTFFHPKSIALIGASNRPGSVGAVLARNLMDGGFDGPIMPVNPKHRSIGGVYAWPDIDSLPDTPDLAIVATPADAVAGVTADLRARGTRAVCVVTAGFGEGGDKTGEARRAALEKAAGPMRILGPNVLGLMVPGMGINASFSHICPPPGDLAFVSQSGAMLTAVSDWAASRGIGFNPSDSSSDGMEAIRRGFTPEFRNRLDSIIQFQPLQGEVIERVVDKFILQLEAQLEARGVGLTVEAEARSWLAERGYDVKMGARPMARVIQDHIKKPLAEELLFGRLANGGQVVVRVDDDAIELDITSREIAEA